MFNSGADILPFWKINSWTQAGQSAAHGGAQRPQEHWEEEEKRCCGLSDSKNAWIQFTFLLLDVALLLAVNLDWSHLELVKEQTNCDLFFFFFFESMCLCFRSQAVFCPILDQSGNSPVQKDPALEQQLHEGMFIFMSLSFSRKVRGLRKCSGSVFSCAHIFYTTLINTDDMKVPYNHRWM